ncbi:hypothetical protein TTHERM_00317190 (macronuclear) [Tetrahymena thermophila SB210]|uniref:Uncharacterized protein n=1 Tax=Tetrahymena thermophila (strain SB210) TaxID=312017 RepID=I7M994_TETTS|nr:hypothetical protein TTHERM_00317190 [Tetrahymena thermophila SB210]EAS01155.1 hypothetical protein TTHERM_00317190 [Tetrahymena thermophila SB210]|eukprot:XP_001021400.1 hypothetical protein TTHERM_00317190 [Tetrahymena thermophila SB210]
MIISLSTVKSLFNLAKSKQASNQILNRTSLSLASSIKSFFIYFFTKKYNRIPSSFCYSNLEAFLR